LRNDARVTNLEKINARELGKTSLPRENYDLVVMDVSFISLAKVLPAAWVRVRQGGKLIVLVKPQFEATQAEASVGRGIIRDPIIHQRVLDKIKTFVATELTGAKPFGEMESPITGGDGNKEFLCGWEKSV
jgi:23S rRNA (cytidine1920-2'-O)/16S rRNA (cytidine1409-2'-O)-methyltransferase